MEFFTAKIIEIPLSDGLKVCYVRLSSNMQDEYFVFRARNLASGIKFVNALQEAIKEHTVDLFCGK